MTPKLREAHGVFPKTRTCSEALCERGRDFGPARPHQLEPEQRPPPSTHPSGATSTRSSRMTRNGESAIGQYSNRQIDAISIFNTLQTCCPLRRQS